jgi:hypothetical protein
MAAFGSTVAAVARLLDGAVYLDPDTHAARLSNQQLTVTVLVRTRPARPAHSRLHTHMKCAVAAAAA